MIVSELGGRQGFINHSLELPYSNLREGGAAWTLPQEQLSASSFSSGLTLAFRLPAGAFLDPQ